MDLMRLLDELRILGLNGARYADNPYDEARYDRILTLVSESYGTTLKLPPTEVTDRLSRDLGHVTPKVGAEAAVFNEAGEILLLRRPDSGTWCLPCGWVEPGEAPAETARRETREETGLDVRPRQLVDLYHLPPGETFGPHGQIAVLYLCDVEGGERKPSHEAEALDYWALEEVPAWFKNHETFARDAQRARETAGRRSVRPST